jgi:uncharacterized protein (DUF362 family)
MPVCKVALIKGDDRQKNIQKTLSLLEPGIKNMVQKITKKKKGYILIKPNFVTTKRQLAATHPDAVEAVLKYLRGFYSGKIIIGEGASVGNTDDGFKNFGYQALAEKYKVELFDLNRDEGIKVEVFDRNLNPLPVKLAKTLINASLKISITPMKTHDITIVTLGIKNMAVGSLLKGGPRLINYAYRRFFKRSFKDYKAIIHQGYRSINRTIAKLFNYTKADLSILDGYEAMERNGPVGGTKVDLKIAIASLDPLAADTLGAHLMGFSPDEVGYLHHLGADMDKIKVVGDNPNRVKVKFRPHDNYLQQLQWK